MAYRVGEESWRTWQRRGFATFLVLSLVIGLWLSFRPSGFAQDDDDVAGGPDPTEATAAEPDEPADEEEGVDSEQDAEAEEDTGLTEEEAEAFIEAARAPEETTVQVLDAGGGATAATDVAETLADLGYDVVATNSSRTDYDVTTVLYTEGNEPEADGLRARDERFTQTAVNERLSEDVDLHVVVGPDWSG